MNNDAMNQAQSNFRNSFIGHFFEGDTAAQFSDGGECKHWLFDIYRTPDEWCFKAGVPITAQQAEAVARYLEAVAQINPPIGGAALEAAINAQNDLHGATLDDAQNAVRVAKQATGD